MKDRLSLYPGRVTLVPVEGQANTYDMVRADQPTEEGTPLNKQTLLSDEVAESLGLSSEANPTPSMAFNHLNEIKVGLSAQVSATLLASNWADGVYTLAIEGVTDTSNQEVLPAVDITTEQLEAMQAANIQDGGQTTGRIMLKAFGDVPTVDLPIRVIKRGD